MRNKNSESKTYRMAFDICLFYRAYGTANRWKLLVTTSDALVPSSVLAPSSKALCS